MTERKITYALSRIKSAKQDGYPLEALLKSYHLNLELIKFILSSTSKEHSFDNKKIKIIIQEFIEEIEQDAELKTIIHKRSIKSLKPWLSKMDGFFKSLKLQQPKNISQLQDETEKIFGLLKISTNKLFAKS